MVVVVVDVSVEVPAEPGDGWLNVFDISDPKQPTLAAAADIRNRFDVSSPHDIELFGDPRYIVGFQRHARCADFGAAGAVRVLAGVRSQQGIATGEDAPRQALDFVNSHGRGERVRGKVRRVALR